MSEILDLLKSNSRYELAGERLTAFGLGLGAGSLNYWNGGWDNNEYMVPEQLENIFSNRDGLIELRDENDAAITPQVYQHTWQPDKTETRFIFPHLGKIVQTRWIYNDVACVELRFEHSNIKPLTLRMRFNGELHSGEQMIWRGKTAELFRKSGKLSDIYRLFTFKTVNCQDEKQINSKGLRLKLKLRPSGSKLYIFWALGQNRSDTYKRIRTLQANPLSSLKKTTLKWEKFFSYNVPGLDGVPVWLKRQYYHLFYVHKANEYPPLGNCLKHPFTCPSKFRLLPQWFWDSAFHSITEKWLYRFAPTEGSLLNLIESRKDGGQMPFCLKQDGFAFDHIFGFPIIQPYVLPLAVWDIFLSTGKISLLKKTLPGLVDFDNWLDENRTDSSGLAFLRIPGESGWDNSARFIEKPSDRTETGSQKASGINPVDFNSIILASRNAIRKMAAVTGNKKLVSMYEVKCSSMTKALKRLWDSRLNCFADRLSNGSLSNVLTPAGFVSMLTGVATKSQAVKMVKMLTNKKHFWTKYPIPTLSLKHKMYNDRDEYSSYWNGRVWPNVNWLVVEGLMKYGFTKVARELTDRSLLMVSASGEPRSGENYHPRQDFVYELSHNALCYGWGGMPNDMLLRRTLGIQPRIHENIIEINPLWTNLFKHAHISNLHLGPACLNIDYEYKNNRIEIIIEDENHSKLKASCGDVQKSLNKGRIKFRQQKFTAGHHWLD